MNFELGTVGLKLKTTFVGSDVSIDVRNPLACRARRNDALWSILF